jgi:hypothetical protein
MAGIDADDDWTTLLSGFLLVGAATGLINPVIADVAVSVVPRKQSGMAARINDTFRQVGASLTGRDYERVPIDIFGGDTLTDAYGKLNPAPSFCPTPRSSAPRSFNG